jgi:hypothetical protein
MVVALAQVAVAHGQQTPPMVLECSRTNKLSWQQALLLGCMCTHQVLKRAGEVMVDAERLGGSLQKNPEGDHRFQLQF